MKADSSKQQKPDGRRTAMQRIETYFRKLNKPCDVTNEQSTELGKIMVDTLFADGRRHQVPKIKVVENEGEMEVILYPSHFVPVMDAVIREYFSVKPEKVKRKRTTKAKATLK